MLRATFRTALAHKGRLALSALAVVLGVAFVAGTYVFTDTLQRTFTDLFDTVQPDVAVSAGGEADAAVGVAATLPGDTATSSPVWTVWQPPAEPCRPPVSR